MRFSFGFMGGDFGKTFAGAKIKLASAKLTNKTKVLLHRTAVQVAFAFDKWYCPTGSGMFMHCTNVIVGQGLAPAVYL